MVDRIAQHRHCKNCEKAIPYGEKYCDEKCEKEHKAELQAKKKQLTYFYLLMVAMFIAAMFMVFVR
jgi:predicted nucleic acid-binding Zn ribbon protein